MQYWMFMSVVLISLVPSILSLKCYVCNSYDDSACADDDKLSVFAQQCPQTIEPFCRKIIQTIDKETSIIRACGSKIGTKDCYKTAGTNHANVCSCAEDLCNNAVVINGKQRIVTVISSIIVLITTLFLLR